jgi:methionyl aminopeptidase
MIIAKSDTELQWMREAGRIVYETRKLLEPHIKPGITTRELDTLAEHFIRSQNAVPSFKNYDGFPGSICTSVNEVLVHGIPDSRRLNEGDIISLDIGAQFNGYHGDSAWTYGVGEISAEARRLLEVTERSLYAGLELVKPGQRLHTISHAIQEVVEDANFSVVREFTGHGVGKDLHEDPVIPNYGKPNTGPRLKPRMVLAIEPIVVMGKRYVRTLDDDWTVVATDGSLSAHFEHTVVVTTDGYEILTIG